MTSTPNLAPSSSNLVTPPILTVTRPVTQNLLLDVNLNYTQVNALDPGATQLIVANLDAINNEIDNVLLTLPGERWGEPDFYCVLYDTVWAPATPVRGWRLLNQIEQALGIWIHYITIDRKNSQITGLTDGTGFIVELKYFVTTTGQNGYYKQAISP